MLIGMMNDPRLPIEEEVGYAAAHGFDFLDLTLEPPIATAQHARAPRARAALSKSGLPIVGHTAYYLPLDSFYDGVRQAALRQMEGDLRTLAELGAEKASVHLLFSNPEKMFSQETRLELWKRVLDHLVPAAEAVSLTLLIEHTTVTEPHLEILRKLLHTYPTVGFHLDVGHANLQTPRNQTRALLDQFGARLQHVHLSDNFGGEKDLHLPLYCGNIDWRSIAEDLHHVGYNGTVTLEVFAHRREYLLVSRDIWRQTWRSVVAPDAPSQS